MNHQCPANLILIVSQNPENLQATSMEDFKQRNDMKSDKLGDRSNNCDSLKMTVSN
jgi:hypothetical protein